MSATFRRPSRARAVLVRTRHGPAMVVVYGILAALSFPTLELLRWRTAAPVYVHDVFDADGAVPRIGATLTQLSASGPSLWDPRIVTGVPSLAHGSLTPIAPDVLIGLLAGPFAAFVITGWLLAFLAGLGMHRFLRDSVRLPTVACLLGASVYLFSFWHYIYGFAAVIAPLVLWAGDRLAARRERRAVPLLVGVAAVALGTYAGLGQIAVLVAGLQLVWVMVGSTAGSRLARVRSWAVIWGLGLGLYLPVILTQLGLLPISVRTIWDIHYLYETRPLPALIERLQFYSSVVLGIPVGSSLGSSPAYYGTYFTGAAGLFLLGTMVLLGRRRRAARFAILILIGIPIVDWLVLVAMPALGSLGTLQSFQFVRIRHLLPFALALGVGIGASRLLALARLRDVQRVRPILTALAVAVMVLVIGQSAVALTRVRPPGGGWGVLGRDLLAVALIAGLVTLAAGLIGGLRTRQHPSGRLAPALILALLLLAIGERVVYAHGERLAGGEIGTWQSRIALTSTQSELIRLAGPQPGRTLTLGDDPNRMSFHGLDQVDGYLALYPVRYHDLFRTLIARCLDADPAKRAYFDGWGQRVYAFCPELDPAILDLLGVRWIDAAGAGPDIPGLVERFRAGGRTLYENPGAFARAFLVGGASIVPDAASARTALESADRSTLASQAIVIAGDARDALPSTPGPAGSAAIVRSDPDGVDVDVRADGSALLILTDVLDPNWTAEVDGRPATIVPVDLAFRGVAVQPGDHRVAFRYRPIGTWVGFGVAGMALIVTVLLAIGLWLREHRANAARSRP